MDKFLFLLLFVFQSIGAACQTAVTDSLPNPVFDGIDNYFRENLEGDTKRIQDSLIKNMAECIELTQKLADKTNVCLKAEANYFYSDCSIPGGVQIGTIISYKFGCGRCNEGAKAHRNKSGVPHPSIYVVYSRIEGKVIFIGNTRKSRNLFYKQMGRTLR